MKTRIILLVTLALALPIAALADNTETFTTSGGTLTGDSQGLVLTGGQLTGVTGLPGGPFSGTNLGSINFDSGVLWNANVTDGGDILPGGSITVTGNGTGGAPNGVLFTGSFDQIQWWNVTTLPDGTHQYTFTGSVAGSDGSGDPANGQFAFSVNTGTNWYEGVAVPNPSTGTLTLAVPEPSELSLLGIGVLGLLGAIRRKVNA